MLESESPLYHQVADQIHALIRAGTLRAGERVPSVRRLSSQQRVSVSTVLQAYQRLEDIGVIEARPQSGYYVRRPSHAMQEPEPSKPPRRAVAKRALEWGCRIDHRDLVTTTGCMEAINLCLRAVTKPGDLVALESPTFYGFLQILQTLGLRALEIPTHPRSGISLEALELALAEHPVKAVLVMPNVSNPIGASMSDPAKKRMVELLAAQNVPLIEDHIYADLCFDAVAPRAAKAYDRAGNVMLCGSFSKTLSPGLKVGSIALFERLLERGITIAPGPMFSASQRYRNCIRLSIGQAWTERHERALRDVGRLACELSIES